MFHGTPTANLNPWSAAKPTRDATGKMRQSGKEANRGSWLLAASQAGSVTNLIFCNDHPKKTYRFEVFGTPAVRRLLEYLDGKETDARELRRLVTEARRSLRFLRTYTPDFEYDDDRGVHHIEDVKGRRDERYRLNRVLMEVCHEAEVEEP